MEKGPAQYFKLKTTLPFPIGGDEGSEFIELVSLITHGRLKSLSEFDNFRLGKLKILIELCKENLLLELFF
ncbi:hypothetical protein P4576_21855 [Peribacillus frigoritolerans]|uniref:hypothetical protein n=1 Tax=Peribacillus frigoritolerans TaxID=450367 RepID=UPI002E227B11|nr:hypothetical protein [Peribacillus frigoritolerans]